MAPMSSDPLAGFGAATRAWFTDSFAAPTAVQRGAWAAIARGDDALVVAPTGSGKTLAAFLSALDRLTRTPAPTPTTRVIYVSPLKALGVDVERNLAVPLRGIERTAELLEEPVAPVRVGVRSGDTTATERRRLISRPPDILITTPESLYLMLTSAARETLRGAETVIIDEIHALAGTKRGAHLSLSLARLDALLPQPAQRIGLSATVRPLEAMAAHLSPGREVTIVAPESAKQWRLDVVTSVDDFADPAAQDPVDPDNPPDPRRRSVWPHLTAELLDLIESHRSTLVFTNSRRLAERLTSGLNELYAARHDNPGAVIARAHHGSVSKDQRTVIEESLKAGQLPCVVATSSLELGIDMGAIDVVVQVGAPPSVASALQRVGRAGHQVGALSHGVFLPEHPGALLGTAVVVEAMAAGAIESVRQLRHPLDVLAQQIVAITAMDPIGVDDLYALVRRAAGYEALPRSAYEAVLDMLAGRYPSEEFAELRPRLIWDRERDELRGRPGAQRLAVTSGGTIPDRGLFGVFLVGDEEGRRVGELDEEMVYESRVGDTFTLGTSTWRIEQITHDQVRVSPAPGAIARLPFWHGDQPGRPAELGRAYGRFLREAATDDNRIDLPGMDARSRTALRAHLAQQRAATGVLPTDRTVVVERFRDELGDWRVCVHTPLGRPVTAAWGLAITARAREAGLEVQVTASDDGLVIAVPDTEQAPPGADLVVLDPGEVEALVVAEVGGSALFASRFREAAGRALLLPKRDPRSRSPLWQQRMRAASLLSVASGHPDFPIVLETMRECLQDVFDLPELTGLLGDIAARRVRVVEVETTQPSPMARSLLFGHVMDFLYAGDTPLAERQVAALGLDPALLAEVLGTPGADQLVDPEVTAEVEAELQALSGARRAHTTEQVFDLIRTLGPLSSAEVAERCEPGLATDALAALADERRIVTVRVVGQERWAALEDLPRLVDGLGIPAPAGFPVAAAHGDPLTDLVLRWARTHGPFTLAEVTARLGLGTATVRAIIDRLVADQTLVTGRFDAQDDARLWCHHRVLALIKRRTLARLRAAVEPVDQASYAAFLPQWQGVGQPATGVDGVLTAVEQLAGVALPASMVESVILPARVSDYAPAMLDELLAAGDVVWTGDGTLGSDDGWVRLWPRDWVAPEHRDLPEDPAVATLVAGWGAGGLWFDDLLTEDLTRDRATSALWQLVWAGRATCDTFAPVRAFTAGGVVKTPRTPRARTRSGMLRAARRSVRPVTSPLTSGRWSLTTPADDSALTERLLAQIDRYGVITRGSVLAESPGGSFGPTYRALSSLEEQGAVLRGYFVAGLGAAQFAPAATVDRLRDSVPGGAVVLAACDPANAYGAALAWPSHPGTHRPTRRAGALVCLVDGHLVAHLERGSRTMLTFAVDEHAERDALGEAMAELARVLRRARIDVTIERVDQEHVFAAPAAQAALAAAGFVMVPQGYRLRG